MSFPSKDSAVARALRVLAYTILPSLVAILADPEVIKNVTVYAPWLLPFIVAGAPVVSLVYNVLRKDVVNY